MPRFSDCENFDQMIAVRHAARIATISQVLEKYPQIVEATIDDFESLAALTFNYRDTDRSSNAVYSKALDRLTSKILERINEVVGSQLRSKSLFSSIKLVEGLAGKAFARRFNQLIDSG